MVARLNKELSGQLDLFAVEESAWQARALESAASVKVGKPASAQITGLANKKPFAGFILDDWMTSLSAANQKNLTQVIQRGIVQGQTTQQITQAIRGTRAMNYKDGVMEVTRRQAEAITRSAVQHVANEARNQVFLENADLLDGVQFVATLDSRTTEICASLDGKVFKIGTAHPQPPMHVNCRSALIPLVKGAPRGVGTRASASGQVSAKTTYGDWLKRQPVAVQNDVLGVTKGKLFREGGLEIDRFVGTDLKPLTLDELRVKESAAFRKADIE
jgi:SPP1 gp7 family putative phage head morphogenesis protein